MKIRARGDLKAIDFLAALSSPLGSIIIMIAIKIALPKRAAAGEQVPFHHSSGTSWASFWLLLYSTDISFGFFFGVSLIRHLLVVARLQKSPKVAVITDFNGKPPHPKKKANQ